MTVGRQRHGWMPYPRGTVYVEPLTDGGVNRWLVLRVERRARNNNGTATVLAEFMSKRDARAFAATKQRKEQP